MSDQPQLERVPLQTAINEITEALKALGKRLDQVEDRLWALEQDTHSQAATRK